MSKKKIFPYYNNFPTQSRLHIIILYFFIFFSTTLITYSAHLDSTKSRIHVLRFHARLDSTESCVHVLFMGPTILFIHLKIILLQCFQFTVSAIISSIQTDPIVSVWIHWSYVSRSCFYFFFFLAHISGAKRLLFMHYLWTVTTTFNQVFRGQCICSWTHKLHFSATFSIKMSPMVLFTHLKFILLQ